MRLIPLLAILLFSCTQSPVKDPAVKIPAESPRLDSLRSSLQVIADSMDIIGFGVAVVDETGVLYADGYGSADLVNDRAYTNNTTQNIASISKVFIGVSLAKLRRWDSSM